MVQTPVKAPWHLWAVGVIATLFNSVGVFDFVMSMAQGTKYLASTGMTPDQINHYLDMPMWMTIIWAVGVFGALGASILLLLRSRSAFPLFVVSFVAYLASLLYTYVLTNGGTLLGRQMAITSVVISALLVAFTVYAGAMAAKGVLFKGRS